MIGQAGDFWNSTDINSVTVTNYGYQLSLKDSAQDASPDLLCDIGAINGQSGSPVVGSETSNDPNPAFMGSYLSLAGSNSHLVVTVGGLTPGDNYTLILYCAGSRLQGNTFDLYTPNRYNSTDFFGSTTAANANINDGAGTAYYEFTGTAAPEGEIIIDVYPNNTTNTLGPFLNGFQILQNPVPEPSKWTMLLGGAGLLALVLLRRGNARRA